MSIKSTIPKYTDDSPYPFGKYTGYAFKEIPADYFHWIWHNTTPRGAEMKGVHNYISERINAFKRENPDLLWSK